MRASRLFIATILLILCDLFNYAIAFHVPQSVHEGLNPPSTSRRLTHSFSGSEAAFGSVALAWNASRRCHAQVLNEDIAAVAELTCGMAADVMEIRGSSVLPRLVPGELLVMIQSPATAACFAAVNAADAPALYVDVSSITAGGRMVQGSLVAPWHCFHSLSLSLAVSRPHDTQHAQQQVQQQAQQQAHTRGGRDLAVNGQGTFSGMASAFSGVALLDAAAGGGGVGRIAEGYVTATTAYSLTFSWLGPFLLNYQADMLTQYDITAVAEINNVPAALPSDGVLRELSASCSLPATSNLQFTIDGVPFFVTAAWRVSGRLDADAAVAGTGTWGVAWRGSVDESIRYTSATAAWTRSTTITTTFAEARGGPGFSANFAGPASANARAVLSLQPQVTASLWGAVPQQVGPLLKAQLLLNGQAQSATACQQKQSRGYVLSATIADGAAAVGDVSVPSNVPDIGGELFTTGATWTAAAGTAVNLACTDGCSACIVDHIITATGVSNALIGGVVGGIMVVVVGGGAAAAVVVHRRRKAATAGLMSSKAANPKDNAAAARKKAQLSKIGSEVRIVAKVNALGNAPRSPAAPPPAPPGRGSRAGGTV